MISILSASYLVRNICLRSTTFGVRNIGPWPHVALGFPIKHRLGPQNGPGSSGHEKMLKIVSCAETEKMKETMVGPQVE